MDAQPVGQRLQKPEFKYPYDPKDKRREDLNAPGEVRRVVRGGAFFNVQRNARCAYRAGTTLTSGSTTGVFGGVVPIVTLASV